MSDGQLLRRNRRHLLPQATPVDDDKQVANLPTQAAPIDVDRPTVTVPLQDTRVEIDQPIDDSVVQHPETVTTESGRLAKNPVWHVYFLTFRDHLHISVAQSAPSFSSTVCLQSCHLSVRICSYRPKPG